MKNELRSLRPPSRWHDYARSVGSLVVSYHVQAERRTNWQECAVQLMLLVNGYHAANSRRSATRQASLTPRDAIDGFCDRALRHCLTESRVKRAARIASPRNFVCAVDSTKSTAFTG